MPEIFYFFLYIYVKDLKVIFRDVDLSQPHIDICEQMSVSLFLNYIDFKSMNEDHTNKKRVGEKRNYQP